MVKGKELKLNREEFEKFKEKYLKRFRKYYRQGTSESKQELYRSIYDNINLTDDEKDEFWALVKAKDNRSEKEKNEDTIEYIMNNTRKYRSRYITKYTFDINEVVRLLGGEENGKKSI